MSLAEVWLFSLSEADRTYPLLLPGGICREITPLRLPRPLTDTPLVQPSEDERLRILSKCFSHGKTHFLFVISSSVFPFFLFFNESPLTQRSFLLFRLGTLFFFSLNFVGFSPFRSASPPLPHLGLLFKTYTFPSPSHPLIK